MQLDIKICGGDDKRQVAFIDGDAARDAWIELLEEGVFGRDGYDCGDVEAVSYPDIDRLENVYCGHYATDRAAALDFVDWTAALDAFRAIDWSGVRDGSTVVLDWQGRLSWDEVERGYTVRIFDAANKPRAVVRNDFSIYHLMDMLSIDDNVESEDWKPITRHRWRGGLTEATQVCRTVSKAEIEYFISHEYECMGCFDDLSEDDALDVCVDWQSIGRWDYS